MSKLRATRPQSPLKREATAEHGAVTDLFMPAPLAQNLACKDIEAY